MTEGSEKLEDAEGQRVPGAESATADPRKFTDYLLSPTHTVGQAKARFFAEFGFERENWEELKDGILEQLPHVPAELSKINERGGENYTAPMTIKAPGGTVDIQTVWEVHPTTGTTFVTAFPLQRSKEP